MLGFGSIAVYLIVHHLANINSGLQRHSTYTVCFDAALFWLLEPTVHSERELSSLSSLGTSQLSAIPTSQHVCHHGKVKVSAEKHVAAEGTDTGSARSMWGAYSASAMCMVRATGQC